MGISPSFSLATAAADKLGGRGATGGVIESEADMAVAIERGFSLAAVAALKEAGVSDKEVADLIIKPRTLSHRKAKGQRLSVEESDRAAKLARVIALAEKTFANDDKAARWLHEKLASLDGRRPIELIRTTAGARIVESILARIAWGAAA